MRLALDADTLFRMFEEAVEKQLGDQVRRCATTAVALWSALANVEWAYVDGGARSEWVGYSWRSAGSLVARIRGSTTRRYCHPNSYMDWSYMEWYGSGPAGQVSEEIANAMWGLGWTYMEA